MYITPGIPLSAYSCVLTVNYTPIQHFNIWGNFLHSTQQQSDGENQKEKIKTFAFCWGSEQYPKFGNVYKNDGIE